MGTVVERKGIWDYAVALFVAFIDDLNHERVVLQGDAEHSLQALLRAVADRINSRGTNKVSVRSAPIGSHQSIGAAERAHAEIGDQVRVLISVIHRKTQVAVHPAMRIFVWLLRHAVYLLNRFSMGSTKK